MFGGRRRASAASSRSILPIVFLTVFIDLLGFGIVIPLLPLYAERYHPTAVEFGLLMSSYSAMQFLFAPLLGRLSDHVGRRPILLLSLVGTAIGYVVFAFARSLGALFVARILDGITGGNIGTAQAVIADTTSREERARGMGLIGMAFGLGFIVGPALGGFAVKLGEAAPGLLAAALSTTAFVWALLRLPETRPPEPTPFRPPSLLGALHALRRPAVGPLLALFGFSVVAFASFEATFSQFLHARLGAGPSLVAWVFVTIGLSAALTQGVLLRRLLPRLGESRLIVTGTALVAAGFFALVAVRSLAGLLPVVVLVACGSGLLNASFSGLVSRRTAAAEQGEVLGAYQSMASLGRIVGPFWGENLFLHLGTRAPHLGSGILQGLVCMAAALALGRGKAANEQSP